MPGRGETNYPFAGLDTLGLRRSLRLIHHSSYCLLNWNKSLQYQRNSFHLGRIRLSQNSFRVYTETNYTTSTNCLDSAQSNAFGIEENKRVKNDDDDNDNHDYGEEERRNTIGAEGN